jgi:glutamyl-tRNA reductase
MSDSSMTLDRRLDGGMTLAMTRLTLIGSDFSRVPPSRLRALSQDSERIRTRLVELRASGRILGGFLLSTCNRVEVLLDLPEAHDSSVSPDDVARTVFGEVGDVPLRQLHGQDCVRHMLSVATGLESMVLGEEQILGQLSRSFTLCEDLGLMSRALHMLRTRVMAAARDLRRRTGLTRADRSVGAVAADELVKAGPSLMVVGAGETARLALDVLRRRGAKDVWIVNRTLEKAEALARHHEGRALSLDEFLRQPPPVDGVLFAVHSDRPLLTPDRCAGLRRVVDISQPSVLDPSVRDVEGLDVIDLDVLGGLLADEAARLEEIASLGRAQVTAQAECIWGQIANRGADLGRVVDLHLESALEELQRALRGPLSHLGEAEVEAVRQLVTKTAKRNAHFHLKDLRQLTRS